MSSHPGPTGAVLRQATMADATSRVCSSTSSRAQTQTGCVSDWPSARNHTPSLPHLNWPLVLFWVLRLGFALLPSTDAPAAVFVALPGALLVAESAVLVFCVAASVTAKARSNGAAPVITGAVSACCNRCRSFMVVNLHSTRAGAVVVLFPLWLPVALYGAVIVHYIQPIGSFHRWQ